MALSKREQYIGIGTGVVLGLLALDHFILTPYTDYRDKLNGQLTTLADEDQKNHRTFQDHSRMQKVWTQMVSDGLKTDPSDAGNQLVKTIREWASESGLTPVSIKPDRPVPENKNYMRVNVRFTATGSTSGVSRMIYRLETARQPVKVTDVQLTSRKEGTDDLQLQLTVSTLCPIPETEKKPDKARTAAVTVAEARGDRS